MIAAALRRSGRCGPSNGGPGGWKLTALADGTSVAYIRGNGLLLETRPMPLDVFAA